jgi:lipocalin
MLLNKKEYIEVLNECNKKSVKKLQEIAGFTDEPPKSVF